MYEKFMHRCLELAKEGRKLVGINPLVGSVLVRKGKVIASAYYKKYGDFHSERILLEKFEQKIYSDDMLYVNLEPCFHHGLTPPCTDIIIQKGIKTVVFGMVDPDARVAGRGIEMLRNNGVEVIGPVLRAESEYLNRGFSMVRKQQRPWITLKIAQTPDGRTACDDGSRLCMTSEQQNRWSHASLRRTHDAILVGMHTVLSDNPHLTIRLNKEFVQPWRIILDPSLQTRLDAHVVSDEHRERTMIMTDPASVLQKKAFELSLRGVRIIPLPSRHDAFSWSDLWKYLITPTDGFPGMSSILVEGGAYTWKKFREAGCVDEEVTLVGKC